VELPPQAIAINIAPMTATPINQRSPGAAVFSLLSNPFIYTSRFADCKISFMRRC
jgi:hypothetical protein